MPLFSEWTRGLDLSHLGGARDPEVTGVSSDSRRIRPGDVFVAIRGESMDGSLFVSQAVDRGAAAVVLPSELRPGPEPSGVGIFGATNPRRALAHLSREVHGAPDRELRLIAVTGTNGKTTVSFLAAELLRLLGARAGRLGTIGYETGRRSIEATWTTPPSEEYFALLREMRDSGLGVCVLEASSHGLDQCRLGDSEVDIAAFTNLTREHLEYHRDLEDYRRAKLRLIDHLGGIGRSKPVGRAVVNMDDPVWAAVEWPSSRIGVGRATTNEVFRSAVQADRNGIRMELNYGGVAVEIHSRLLGDYNVENLTVLAGIARAMDLSPDQIAELFCELPSVPGRLERVELGEGAPLILIDYAHTPDALASVLASLRAWTPGRLRVVFGCGGDRDRGKRAPMARAAAAGSDRAILTLDNPRHEDPQRIFDDARAGFSGHDDHWAVVEDRREALRQVLQGCSEEDTVLIAGKGHERYQIMGDEKEPWDDREELIRIWKEGGLS